MSYLKDREIWLSNVPTGNPPTGYFWKFIQNGKVVVRDSSGNNQIMVATSGSQAITGSLTVTGGITGTATTASYVEYSNVANKPALVSGSSQITYSGLSSIPSGIVSGSTQIADFGIFATTGSNGFNGNQSITGSLTVTGQVVAQTLNVQQVTSSIVYSSGSNIFGNELSNTQQFTGSLQVSGSIHHLLGNVLVGTTTDNGARLQVNGTATIARNDSANISLTISNAFINQGNLINFQHNSGGSTTNAFIGHGGDSTGNLIFINNSIQALTIARSTGAATFNSSVTADSSAFIGQVPTYGSSFAQFSHSSRAGANQYSFLSHNNGETMINSTSNQSIFFRHNNSNLAVITSGGNVLIGTTSDNGNRLRVNGNSDFVGTMFVNTPSSGAGVTFRTTGNTNNPGIFFITDESTSKGTILVSGSTGALDMALGAGGTERVFIKGNTGNVGIGTNNPQARLDLGSSSNGNRITWENYSNVFSEYSSGDLWLSSNFYGNLGSSGYVTSVTAAFGAAGIAVSGTGASLNGVIRFFVDSAASKTAGASFTPTERMRITSGGNVQINTNNSPLARLHIADTLDSIMLLLRSGNDAATGISFTSTSPGGSTDNYTINHTIVHGGSGGYRIEHNATSRWIRMIAGSGGVELAGTATSWTSISDIRKKDVLQTGISNALNKINSIDAIFYKYKNEELLQDGETLPDGIVELDQPIKIKQRRIGLIAQQIQEVLPEAVTYNEEEDTYRLSYTEIIPLLVESIKEQQTLIESLKSRIEILEQ